MCGPARRTILTGLYPHNHKEIHCAMNHPYDKDIYHDILAKSGYENFYYGKWHAGEGSSREHNCNSYAIGGNAYGNPYLSVDYAEYIRKRNLPYPKVKISHNFCEPERYSNVSRGDEYLQDKSACNEDTLNPQANISETMLKTITQKNSHGTMQT